MGNDVLEADTVSTAVFETARERVVSHLNQHLDGGQSRITLAELTEATALDPQTAETVMRDLEARGPLVIRRTRGSERAWSIRREG